MAQRAAFFVKAYSIPIELFVNMDQTGIHVVPTGGARIWAKKGSKHVLVHGMEDKKQVTISVSSSASGNLLPFQVVFTGLTDKSLPPRNPGRLQCEGAGWQLTCSKNHWSNMSTCQEFVETILQPYRKQVIAELNLDKDSKLVWLLDSWSVHKSKEFVAWIKETHPNILLIFVPANCTSIYQPADVILQRPFKHGFRKEFNIYTRAMIDKQLEVKDAKDVKLDFHTSTLKPLLCSWLFKAWQHVNKPEMIKLGWAQCGLDQVFNSSFQSSAIEEHTKTPLFKDTPLESSEAEETVETRDEEEIDPDDNIEGIMEEGLVQVFEFISTNKKSTISSLKSLL